METILDVLLAVSKQQAALINSALVQAQALNEILERLRRIEETVNAMDASFGRGKVYDDNEQLGGEEE
jgi:hypothetical protein